METIQIGRYNITIKELTYWAKEEIKSQIMEGVKIKGNDATGITGYATLEAKKKTFESSIVEIKEGEKIIPYSIEWLKGLTVEEGDAIELAIDNISKKK